MMGKYYKKILKLDERKNNSFLSTENGNAFKILIVKVPPLILILQVQKRKHPIY